MSNRFQFWYSIYHNELQGLYFIYCERLKEMTRGPKQPLTLYQFSVLAYQHSSHAIPYYEIEYITS